MSTEIKSIQGSCHSYPDRVSFKVEHAKAEVALTRFYNGKERGANIQLTVSQEGGYGTSYIHLTQEQCKNLAQALIDSFDYEKYPSE